MQPSTASLSRRLAGQSRAFRALLPDARAVQERRLQAILQRHRDCEYGRRHAFDALTDAGAFQRRVPIVGYDELRPAIARMTDGEQGVLVSGPVVAFEETGGSSGGSKFVPYTEAALDGFRRGLLPWLDDLYITFPGLDGGSAYWSISPACRPARHTPGGVPIGLPGDAAYFGADIAQALMATLCVPPQAGMVRDVDLWRRYTVSRLLADESLALISVWSPTFLLELLRHAQEDIDRVAACIAGEEGFDSAGHDSILPPLVADAGRARQVRAVLAEAEPDWSQLWPKLALVSCWDQAAARPLAHELRVRFPTVTVQGKGLLATEGMVSIPLHDRPMPVLAVDSGFFEFVDEQGRARLVDEVTPGATYDLLITNDSGFYRYAIGDRVHVHGFAGQAPLLEFVGRSGLASDLAGEKLTEDFVASALAELGLRFAMVAPRDGPVPGYVLLVDGAEVSAADASALAARADIALGANPQYSYARRMRQLAMLACRRCHEPLRHWIDTGLARGQRLGDIKPAVLCVDAAAVDRFTVVP